MHNLLCVFFLRRFSILAKTTNQCLHLKNNIKKQTLTSSSVFLLKADSYPRAKNLTSPFVKHSWMGSCRQLVAIPVMLWLDCFCSFTLTQ